MNFEDIINAEELDFSRTDASMFLLGLLSAFDNRYQATADSFFEEISWKQFFAIISINLFKEAPTIKQLAELMGSSHQNVKQILLKLEKKGFVDIIIDENDKRKQRIILTEKTRDFCKEHDEGSKIIISSIFRNISSEQIKTTIETIILMEKNLNNLG